MKLPSYPLTLAAVKKRETSLWDIGDALLKECPPDSERGNLAQVVAYLQANGCEYSGQWLFEIRGVAASFPPKSRRREFAFVVHQEAETPGMLEAVIKGAPAREVISHRYVRKIVDQIRDQDKRERREVFERAQAKRQAAEAKEQEKLTKAQQAKSEQERKELAREHRKAAQRAEEAREAEQAVRMAPRKKPAPPNKEEVPVLVAEAGFMADASEAARLARRSKESIAKCLDQLTAKGVAALTDSALEAANAWTEAAQIVRKEILDQRGHLSVMER